MGREIQTFKFASLFNKSVMENIKPTTKKEDYILEDKDYLLIKAMQELTSQIRRLANK